MNQNKMILRGIVEKASSFQKQFRRASIKIKEELSRSGGTKSSKEFMEGEKTFMRGGMKMSVEAQTGNVINPRENKG